MVFRFILVGLVYILLAAHFLRDGNIILVTVCILVPFLLFLKKRWALLFVQLGIFLGVIVWVLTTISIMQYRIALGEPWVRMVLILGSVALLTAATGLSLNSKAIRERYH